MLSVVSLIDQSFVSVSILVSIDCSIHRSIARVVKPPRLDICKHQERVSCQGAELWHACILACEYVMDIPIDIPIKT